MDSRRLGCLGVGVDLNLCIAIILNGYMFMMTSLSCFGRVVQGVDIVTRMLKQPGAGPSGFITSDKNYIKILSLNLLPDNMSQ